MTETSAQDLYKHRYCKKCGEIVADVVVPGGKKVAVRSYQIVPRANAVPRKRWLCKDCVSTAG
jgi:hypothetical protein